MRTLRIAALLLVICASQSLALSWQVNPSNGHRYALLPPMIWQDAEAAAVGLGGHLATIRNETENQWVFENIVSPSGYCYAWLGLYQLPGSAEPDGGWVWASGESVTYVNWSPGEPSNYDYYGGENWAMMYGLDCPVYSRIPVPSCWNDTSSVPEYPLVGIVETVPEPSTFMAVVFSLCGVAVAIRRPK